MSREMPKKRGYFGIGVYHSKIEENIGTLWRSAYIYGASFLFTVGRRYKKQCTDTLKTFRYLPIFHFETFEEFKNCSPFSCPLVCIEISKKSMSLEKYEHPQQAVYLLGAEDYGIPEKILKENKTISIPSTNPYCLNVAVAGSIILYDRFYKQLQNNKEVKNDKNRGYYDR